MLSHTLGLHMLQNQCARMAKTQETSGVRTLINKSIAVCCLLVTRI